MDFFHLLLLKEASSNDIVSSIIDNVFRFRHDDIPSSMLSSWSESLSLSLLQTQQMISSLSLLILNSIKKRNISIDNDFPLDFHIKLKELLVNLISAQLPEWIHSSLANQISCPKLIDFDWRVDIKTSSNHLSHMSVPTVLVDLEIQETPQISGIVPNENHIQLELNREALTTLVEGLSKINEQLITMKS